jgi:pimeloyl-ACP methyl ester carboxylesterase
MTHRVRILVAAGVLAASVESISLTPFAAKATAPAAARLPLQPCHLDGLSEEVLCGVHEVFENRAAGSGRRLSIHVAVLPALRRAVEPDPLFLMAGGPGQGARGMAGVAERFFREIRRSREIVLVDLRGTGASHALTCDPGADELTSIADGDAAGAARRCAAALDADPRFYTHRDSLADLDEIRARLGYERINLWGGSWGTRASLLYALRYPAQTRSVVLDGAVPLTLDFPSAAAPDAEAALERVIAACTADSGCRDVYPEPRADLARLLDRFSTGEVSTTIPHPRTGMPAAVRLSRGVAMDIIRGALYVPRDAAAVMFLIQQAADGNFAPLVAQHVQTASWSTDDMALAATMSVLCSEDLPVTPASVTRAGAGSVFGTAYADTWSARCEGWQRGPRLDDSRDAVSQAPALILSGGHDPVTPPRTGDLMARHFPHHRHIVVDYAAHNTSFSGCVPRLIAQFIADGHGEAIDAGCVTGVAWPPFVIGTAGSRP